MNYTISATRRICGFLPWSIFSSSVFVYFLFLCYFIVLICCLCAITCSVFVDCFAFIVFLQICQNPIICIRVRMHEIRCVHIYFSAYASFRWLGFMFWYIFLRICLKPRCIHRKKDVYVYLSGLKLDLFPFLFYLLLMPCFIIFP